MKMNKKSGLAPLEMTSFRVSLSLTGFTLVEILIASAIFVVVMTTIYSVFSSGIFGYKSIDGSLKSALSSRQILERINLDLRNSFAYSAEEAKFIGDSGELKFLTIVNVFAQGQIRKKYAFVNYNTEGGHLKRLCRKDQDSLNERSTIESEEMSENTKVSFEYGYIDRAQEAVKNQIKWIESWPMQGALEDNKGPLPAAVRIKLVSDDKTKQSFERTVYLPLAI